MKRETLGNANKYGLLAAIIRWSDIGSPIPFLRLLELLLWPPRDTPVM